MRRLQLIPSRPGRLAGFLVVCLGLAADAPKGPDQTRKPSNRLAGETSPYLLQHAHNPVDWYPWGPEAFERARKEHKPIFLSIGYSSCYWCHVMERECFENEAIARLMNEEFVCIKVDREERPDVDQVYMTALQAFAGNGGWPLSMFLTPDGRPFFGGTYFPPTDKGENHPPPFPEILKSVSQAWRDQPKEIDQAATQVAEAVRRFADRTVLEPPVPLSEELLQAGVKALAEQFDPEFGGFGYSPDQPRRPKFPEPTNLVFLLDRYRSTRDKQALEMVLTTLDHLARGGIRDHLGGGYHRYSVDRAWQVPHFEKMLYDNAQLASIFLDAYEITGNDRWRREAEAIFEFVARELTAPEGGFYSALDAETDGDEGGSYVWTREETRKRLGADAEAFEAAYGLDREPNFEEARYVLILPKPLDTQTDARLAPLRNTLLEARQKRPAPRRDDKVLTSWNGLMIAAYADGYRVLKEDRFRLAAEKAADFLWTNLRAPDGRLLRTWREGKAKLPAYLEDYAYFAEALLRLHEATGNPVRLEQARTLADRMLSDFTDDARGGFFATADDHETLLARFKDPYDNAVPNGNAMAVRVLLTLARTTGEARYRDAAEKALKTFSPTMKQTPAGVPLLLVGLAGYLAAAAPAEPAPPPPQAGDDPLGLGNKDVLTARIILDPASQKPKPGDTVTLKVILTIKPGWHVYANPPGLDLLRPTTVELDAKAPAKLTAVTYPRGVPMPQPGGTEIASVYEGSPAIPVKIKLDAEIPAGATTLPFRVRYQACNDRLCLAPAVLALPVKLTVASP